MGSLSGLLTRNWTLKLSAFGVALLLWVTVRAEAPNEGDALIPVRVDVTDPAWTLVGDPVPSEVTVHFGAPVSELFRMIFDPPPIVIPVDRVTSPDTVVVLRTAWLRVPDDVVPASVDPPAVRLRLEPVDRTAVPAVPTFIGELPVGLAIAAEPALDPAEVRVAGARSRVAALVSVPLVPLDLSGITESGFFDLAVDTIGLGGLTLQPRTVRLEVRLAERTEMEVTGVPIVLPPELAGDSGLGAVPATGAVVLQGARALLDGVDRSALRLVARGTPAGTVVPAGSEVGLPLEPTGLPAFVSGRPRPETVRVRTGGEMPR